MLKAGRCHSRGIALDTTWDLFAKVILSLCINRYLYIEMVPSVSAVDTWPTFLFVSWPNNRGEEVAVPGSQESEENEKNPWKPIRDVVP